MDPTASKALAMGLLGGVSVFLGLIPLKVGKWFLDNEGNHRHGTILSSLLCFGGGVLFATSFVHMLPEVQENFQESGIMDGNQFLLWLRLCYLLGSSSFTSLKN